MDDETLVQHQVQQNKTSLDQSECIVNQPSANGILPHHDTAQTPGSEDCDISIGRSVTDSLTSNDNAQLLHGSSPGAQPQTANSPRSYNRNNNPLHDHHLTGANQRETSRAPSTTNAHIKQAAGGDCCVHCLLACLFCELPSLCSALAQCLLCGEGVACAEAAGCSEECGVIETCCGSTDCLEICLECCFYLLPLMNQNQN
ncbi:hypothetical protein WMY93_027703 [Mugilogobius chulae]|uniref:MyoD family inhibitor domain-containing protein n=1 Tax=Mugilogobius chulae TaxID=88201 RepID=A0AAW0MY00_9GOBI